MGNTQTYVKNDEHLYVFQKNETKRIFDKKYYISCTNTSYCAIGIKIIENMISVYYIDGSDNVLKNTYTFDRQFNKQMLRLMLSVSYIYKLLSLIGEGRLIICRYADISNGGIEYIGKYDIPEIEGLQKIELLENHYCLIYERSRNLCIRFVPYIVSADGSAYKEFNLGGSLFRFSRCCKYFMIIGKMIEIYSIGSSIERISQKENTFDRFNINMNGAHLVRWGESANKLFIETFDFETLYCLDIPQNDSIEYIIYDYSDLGDIISASNLLLLVGINRMNQQIVYHLISPTNKYGPFYIMRNENIISFCSHGPYIIYGVPDGTIIYCFDHFIPILILEIIRNETKKYIDRENEVANERIRTDNDVATIMLMGADDSVATYRMDRKAISILSRYNGMNSMDITCNIKIYNEMTSFEIFIQMIAENRIDRPMIHHIDEVILNMLVNHMIEYVRSFIDGEHLIAYCGYLIMEIILLRMIGEKNNLTCVDLFVLTFPIFKQYLYNCIVLIKK